MDELPTFRLFGDPVAEESLERRKGTCDLCGKSRAWAYVGNTYGEQDDPDYLCPWCIADGTAAAKGYSFNSPDIFPVKDGNPQLPLDDAEEVEQRTPGFTTWQDHGWQMCCGRACRYIGEADAADLKGRWAGAVESIVAETYGYGWSDKQRAELISSITKGGSPCAYVFECVVCGKLCGFWDCD